MGLYQQWSKFGSRFYGRSNFVPLSVDSLSV
jgi:hypothetical protein